MLNGVFHERIEYPDPPAVVAPVVQSMSSTEKKPNESEEEWDGETVEGEAEL